MKQKPFPNVMRRPGSGIFFLALLVFMASDPRTLLAGDGATEALELRWHAEMAMAKEDAEGRPAMADAMRATLPKLLLDHVATHDESIAIDVVDAALVRQHAQLAQLIDQPGLAWALDVFAGPGTGNEQNIRTAMASLADFHEVRARQATEMAAEIYERTVEQTLEHPIEHTLDKLDRLEEKRLRMEEHRNEVILHHLDRQPEHVKTIEHLAEKTVEKLDKLAEKAQQETEKLEDKLVKEVEKQADKEAEKVQKDLEKAAEEVVPVVEPQVQNPPEVPPVEDDKKAKPKGGK